MEGPAALDPPAAPPGAPEPEEAELEEDERGRGGLDLGLNPADSRLISGGETEVNISVGYREPPTHWYRFLPDWNLPDRNADLGA